MKYFVLGLILIFNLTLASCSNKAAEMFETAKFSQSQLCYKDAAFLLHQTAERLYHCVLLVVTGV